MMNQRAQELGMTNTSFVNACGIDADNHITTARDIAIMSRELTVNHSKIFEYSSIWMDTITHVTGRGESQFGLANTNKMLKSYSYCTGLKTGFTDKAGFAISATASKDGVDLIAVVMGASTKEIRNTDATKLLEYGFANCQIYKDEAMGDKIPVIPVKKGEVTKIQYYLEKNTYSYVLTAGQSLESMEKKINIVEELKAPIKKGDKIGEVQYYYDESMVGSVSILAAEDVKSITYFFCFQKVLGRLVGVK